MIVTQIAGKIDGVFGAFARAIENKGLSEHHPLLLWDDLFLRRLLRLGFGSLFTHTHQPSIASCVAQSSIGRLLALAHLAPLDLAEGCRFAGGVLDRQNRAGLSNNSFTRAGGLHILGRGISFLVLAGPTREQDQTGLVGFEPLDIDRKRFHREVATTVVDGNADGGREFSRDARFLKTISHISSKARWAISYASKLANSYLQLLEREASARPNTTIVFDGRATNDRSKLVNRARSHASDLGLPRRTTALLTAGLAQCPSDRIIDEDHRNQYLVEVHAHTTLPILAEVYQESENHC